MPDRYRRSVRAVGLARPVVSDPAVCRLMTTLAADLPQALRAIRAARAAAREPAWALAGPVARPPGATAGLQGTTER